MIHFQVVAEKEKTAREKAERRLFAARIVSLEVAGPLSDHTRAYMRRLPLWNVAAAPDPDGKPQVGGTESGPGPLLR